MKIVALSDTHGRHRQIEEVPEGDVLVHAGDMTKHGQVTALKDFCDWISQFDHDLKLVVGGNHDICLDGPGREKEKIMKMFSDAGVIYLEDGSCLFRGTVFYGSPYSESFEGYAFNDDVPDIPPDADVVITHGPPHGIMDSTELEGTHIGNKGVRKQVEEILLTKDHVTPSCEGGNDHIENYQTMCYPCNREKGGSLEE